MDLNERHEKYKEELEQGYKRDEKFTNKMVGDAERPLKVVGTALGLYGAKEATAAVSNATLIRDKLQNFNKPVSERTVTVKPIEDTSGIQNVSKTIDDVLAIP